tara:strand:- start:699 stop:1238 length:540 start_codon:yes stop_codon:yes gene_type:complete
VLTIIVIALFVILMFWAAYSDLTSYTLSNKLCLSVALLYPIYLLSRYLDGQMLPWFTVLLALGIAALIFIIFAVLFALNIMGGGDVKLIPAVALWAGPAYSLQFLFLMALIGGGIAAVILLKNRLKASKYYKSSENINLSVAEKNESAVPYGVGIAGGGIYVAYHLATTLNQFTAISQG